jgi:formate hydrogenlyase transcriptional activator
MTLHASAPADRIPPNASRSHEILRLLLQGTSNSTGDEFLRQLVRHAAVILGVRYACISQILPGSRVRTRSFWSDDDYADAIEYGLDGTPCKGVIDGETRHYTQNVQHAFPHDRMLAKLGVSGYFAFPLRDAEGRILGHFAAMDVKPMPLDADAIAALELVGERAGIEIGRQVLEASLAHRESTLRAIVEGTAGEVGDDFLRSLVKNLATALDVKYAFMSEFCADRTRVRTLAFWAGDHFFDNFEYVIAHTPCEKVLAGEMYYCADGVPDQFPLHKKELDDLDVVSYLAIPVTNANGQVLGHLAIMDTKPLPIEESDLSTFRIFGARAGAELERTHMEAMLKDNEERMRDLFDEAPIAYVHEGLDTKLLRVNHAGLKALGITADQVKDLYGKDFIPDTPDAQRRLQQAIDAFGRGGTDSNGVVLELRRKDNGMPLWIQWWSRPDPGGTYTRTMFLDITERILLEQEKARLEAHNLYLQEEIKINHNFEELIGSSVALKKVLGSVERVAPTESTVLISGETGTGKELIARAIHNLSPRRERPLVKVNCAAIPSGLIESELFGHEKGAFTGALTKRIGRFELADRGTIFLDEVGELPLDLQSKLLRVLQEGEFERVGGTQTLKTSVRVIAASNRDLAQLAKSGDYRPDLYYRLNVFPIHLPPLREREGDLLPLAQYFVRKYASALGKKIERISERMWAAMTRYNWPGNIRELEHVIERAVILTEADELVAIDGLTASGGAADNDTLPTLEALERDHIIRVLKRTQWRVSGNQGAAAVLGLKPTTLEARMKKLGIARGAKA